MKTRLVLVCVLVAHALCGCVSDPPRPAGSVVGKTYKEEIGKPLPLLPSVPDCPVR